MKFLVTIFLLLSFSGPVFGADDSEVKIIIPKADVKKEVVKPEKIVEADSGNTMSEAMTYETCRESLAAAEAMSSVYNVIFDYPKGQKFDDPVKSLWRPNLLTLDQ